jgi:hypothetical protein
MGDDGADYPTINTWQVRHLNSVVYDSPTTGITLNTYQLTIPAGTWEATWHATTYNCGRHLTRLWNVTDSVRLILGSSGDMIQGDAQSYGMGRFVLTGTKVVELHHRGNIAGKFGLNNNTDIGIFASLRLRKLKGT